MDAVKEHKKIFVLVEKEDGNVVAPITFELLKAGRMLADKIDGILCSVVLGHEVSDISHEISQFSDEVYLMDDILFSTFQVDFYVEALEKLCRNLWPHIILLGHTLDNLGLAPRLACRIGAKLITDCIHLEIGSENENLLCTKPVYGDNVIAVFEIKKKPQMVTLRPKVMENIERNSIKGKVISFAPGIDKSTAKTEIVEGVISTESVSLDKADAIVAGGRGIKRIEDIEQLKELGDVLKKHFVKVELGASRPVVDAGWLSHSRQVGLTGVRVSPQLYIAIGISGASQHLSGILGSKKIIAINKDDQAYIMGSADYGVIGNYGEILPAFIKKLREL